jgi:hypothetical protein
MLFVVALFDRYLQRSEKREINRAIAILHEQIQQQRDQLWQQYQSVPAMGMARVTKVYQMGGSHALMHVHVDDTIEILQENVGPSKAYHLCRVRDPITKEIKSIGWYPSSHLELLATNTTISWWNFWR